MSPKELDKLTMKELHELKDRVNRLITRKQIEERRNLLDQFREMADASGFTLSELTGSGRGKGRAVAAKYVNPSNPTETWSGRGRPPRWLAAKVKSGAKFDDFKI